MEQQSVLHRSGCIASECPLAQSSERFPSQCKILALCSFLGQNDLWVIIRDEVRDLIAQENPHEPAHTIVSNNLYHLQYFAVSQVYQPVYLINYTASRSSPLVFLCSSRFVSAGLHWSHLPSVFLLVFVGIRWSPVDLSCLWSLLVLVGPRSYSFSPPSGFHQPFLDFLEDELFYRSSLISTKSTTEDLLGGVTSFLTIGPASFLTE